MEMAQRLIHGKYHDNDDEEDLDHKVSPNIEVVPHSYADL
jgi:hypothetical protein